MSVVSYTHLRQHLVAVMDEVRDGRSPRPRPGVLSGTTRDQPLEPALDTEVLGRLPSRGQTHDPSIADKIEAVLKTVRLTPVPGVGKPEPLKGKVAGWRCRRIAVEHHLVHRVNGSGAEQRVEIAQCRYHY